LAAGPDGINGGGTFSGSSSRLGAHHRPAQPGPDPAGSETSTNAHRGLEGGHVDFPGNDEAGNFEPSTDTPAGGERTELGTFLIAAADLGDTYGPICLTAAITFPPAGGWAGQRNLSLV